MEETQSAGHAGEQPRQFPMIDTFCEELKQFLRSLEPAPEAVQHFRNARVEMLKGMRELIDRRIENLSRRETHGKKINVE